MHAYKLNVTILPDHELAVRLPDDFPSGPAEVIILVEREAPAVSKQPRPLGLDAGRVIIHPSFFDPLPDDILDAFEGKST